MDEQDELGRLRERVNRLEHALAASRREVLESHARLTIISRIVQNTDRCERAPSVCFGAVRSALYAEHPPKNLLG
ncbi:hypothetical protein [Micromonospora zhanjiangensis]|uniref:Uncharacterized protein n=1 Tax=Micromonospora zhanjiangensis TaxID=1522057 RepID=A0ABV8KFE2_9ACTN